MSRLCANAAIAAILTEQRDEVQAMWHDPEMRNAVRLSQTALLRRLEGLGLTLDWAEAK